MSELIKLEDKELPEFGCEKHGFYIKQHKKTYEKIVYNNGYIMRRYRKIPKIAYKFKSPMVNDHNLHFVGGWSMRGLDNSELALIKRTLSGLKPFSHICIVEESKEKVQKVLDQYLLYINNNNSNNKYKYFIVEEAKPWGHGYCCVFNLFLDQSLTATFDMEALIEDYYNAGLDWVGELLRTVSHMHISDFKNLDINSNIYIVGLLLGYSVDTTISLYYQY